MVPRTLISKLQFFFFFKGLNTIVHIIGKTYVHLFEAWERFFSIIVSNFPLTTPLCFTMLLNVTDAQIHLYRKYLFIFYSVFSFSHICLCFILSSTCQRRNETVHLKSYGQASSVFCAILAK